MSDEKFVLNTGDKLLAAISEKEYVRDPNHKYIVFTEKPPKGFISQAATILMDFYLPSLKQSLSKWQKDKKLYGVNWHQISTGKPMVSSPLNYLLFSKNHEIGKMIGFWLRIQPSFFCQLYTFQKDYFTCY